MAHKIVMMLTLLLAGHGAFAQVPTEALTFETNLTLFNATASEEIKIRTAEDLIKRVIATEEFRNEVLNHTYNGKKTYVDNGGFTNAQIYQKIIDGAEKLQPTIDNEMDMEVEFYYEYSSTVGYTNTGSKRIWVNRKYYNNYTAVSATSNLTHEWLHKLGFSHAVSYSTSRDYSVPYAIGRIMSRLAAIEAASISAPKNLLLARSGSNVTLTWNAASSSAGIKEYKIYRRLDGSSTNYLQGTVTGLSFTQAAASTSGYYYVTAIDNDANTANSSEVRYLKSYLNAVTNLALTITTSNVVLNWTASSSSQGVKEYKIYRKLSGSSTSTLQGTVAGTTFTQAKPSSDATYYVKTVDNAGSEINSTTVNYKAPVLTAPTNLTLTKGTSTVTLKWTAATSPKGIKEYKIYRRLDGSSTNYLQGTTTSLTWSQSKPTKSGYYYVRAVENTSLTTIKSAEVRYTR